MKQHTFKKPEHLCLQTEIEALFAPGSPSVSVYPVRAVFRVLPYGGRGPRVKVLLSVSKRRLRHAVDRNRAKRQLREAYRLQKRLLWDVLPAGAAAHVAFIWLADHTKETPRVQRSVGTLLQRIGEKCAKAAAVPE